MRASDSTKPVARLRPSAVILLATVSGFCSLVYQVAWLRELRLVFGHSTAASAAVVAAFMAGLGVGSVVLGRRADASANPLLFLSKVEAAIALLAGLSPALLVAARAVYIALGGAQQLGDVGASMVRLLLGGVVVGGATFFMGGTLAAAARSIETDTGTGRLRTAALYGMNTLGAVTGAFVANFAWLEIFGTRETLWLGAAVNGIVVLGARRLAPRYANHQPSPETEPAQTLTQAALQARPILLAAALSGFVFFLLELVWYRTLAPLLGGSIYTFGLILVIVLLGLGAGGLAYAMGLRPKRVSIDWLALSLILEGATALVPILFGDRIAVSAAVLHNLQGFGFWGAVVGWCVVGSWVVLPTALIAGWQFPLFFDLAGRGPYRVGTHIGLIYGANTLGAIAGSLAGGFGLMSLGAVLVWKTCGAMACALGVLLALWPQKGAVRRIGLGVTQLAGVVVVIVALHWVVGPTAAWRHNPIGAGRAKKFFVSQNDTESWLRERRRLVVWEADGRESAVALGGRDGLNFLVNGKSDGHCVTDAGTQIMLGLTGALLHPNPQTAAVIGLGTGSTSGWLGSVPDVQRVDSIELEPAIANVARACAAVNRDVMNNPKVNHVFADAREFLQTTDARYDLVVSEPSNPYRAGVSSLLTQEFYQAVSSRMKEGGLFLQWVQAYEIDAETLYRIYATIQGVFPHVHTWRTMSSDLLLVASGSPLDIDPSLITKRLGTAPLTKGLQHAWGASTVEDVLGHIVGNNRLAQALSEAAGEVVNRDNHILTEFGFARTLGRTGGKGTDIESILNVSIKLHALKLPAGVDQEAVVDARLAQHPYEGRSPPDLPAGAPLPLAARAGALEAFTKGKLLSALHEWDKQARPPRSRLELIAVGSGMAQAGDHRLREVVELLSAFSPYEAQALNARYAMRSDNPHAAGELLRAVWTAYQNDPWLHPVLMKQTLELAVDLVKTDPAQLDATFEVLAKPFAVRMADERRLEILAQLAERSGDFGRYCLRAFEPLEPHFPWNAFALERRVYCYAIHEHPLLTTAKQDLASYWEHGSLPFGVGIAPAGGAP